MPAPMFGTGTLTAISTATTPVPSRLATLQDISLDLSFSEKELRGENQFPDDLAHADGKITVKAKNGKLNSGAFALLLAGSSSSTGRSLQIAGESATIPAPSGPYTVQVAQHATFEYDEGVLDTTTGLYMTPVASGPAAGQYSYSAGTYTFAAADASKAIKIYYTYTSTGGVNTAYSNQLQGTRTTFRLDIFNSYNGKAFGYRLWNVASPKLALAAKNNDYTMQDIDFTCAADSTGRVITLYTED